MFDNDLLNENVLKEKKKDRIPPSGEACLCVCVFVCVLGRYINAFRVETKSFRFWPICFFTKLKKEINVIYFFLFFFSCVHVKVKANSCGC